MKTETFLKWVVAPGVLAVVSLAIAVSVALGRGATVVDKSIPMSNGIAPVYYMAAIEYEKTTNVILKVTAWVRPKRWEIHTGLQVENLPDEHADRLAGEHLSTMKMDGSLASVVTRLGSSGKICAQYGHHWGPPPYQILVVPAISPPPPPPPPKRLCVVCALSQEYFEGWK